MLILKIVLTLVIIISLALVAQRVSSRLAGLLSALPMGTALVLFFYGLEFGSEYVNEVSSFNIFGLSASLSFVIFYFIGSNLYKDGVKSILSAFFLAIFAYLTVAFTLSSLEPNGFLLPSVILLSTIAFGAYIFKNIPDTRIKNTKKTSVLQLILRSLIATSIITLISFAPEYLPSSIAGILSSFPSVVVPLLLIIHISFGRESMHEAVKVMPLSYISILIYSLSIGKTYMEFGVYYGTIISFIISISYILALLYFTKAIAQAKLDNLAKIQ